MVTCRFKQQFIVQSDVRGRVGGGGSDKQSMGSDTPEKEREAELRGGPSWR